jgi:dephospho-CoA kinase
MPDALAIEPVVARRPSFIPAEEQVILEIGPSPWFILLRSLAAIGALIFLAGAAWWMTGAFGYAGYRGSVLQVAGAIAGSILAWNTVVWSSRDYILTDRRIMRAAGVFRRIITDAPLRQVQHVTLTKLVRERLVGIGTLSFNTAGTAWTELAWVMIDQPERTLDTVRRAIEASGAHPARAMSKQTHRIPVIGLAGGIGAGKSEVARILAELGAVVIDSDAQARAALDRPEVKDELVRWWGPAILGQSGAVARSAVANIVFRDETQRRRLEALIHPLVRERRAEIIERARLAGAPLAVIDAPLLFEAGVDAECDTVIFVDAPRSQRLARVQATRGWDEHELDRREHSQLSLDDKRARSRYTVLNDGDLAALRSRVQSIYSRVLAGP